MSAAQGNLPASHPNPNLHNTEHHHGLTYTGKKHWNLSRTSPSFASHRHVSPPLTWSSTIPSYLSAPLPAVSSPPLPPATWGLCKGRLARRLQKDSGISREGGEVGTAEGKPFRGTFYIFSLVRVYYFLWFLNQHFNTVNDRKLPPAPHCLQAEVPALSLEGHEILTQSDVVCTLIVPGFSTPVPSGWNVPSFSHCWKTRRIL